MTMLAPTVLASGWDGVPPAQAGPLGLLVLVLLGVAVVFLYRSMNKHLRRLPESFDPPAQQPPGQQPPAEDPVTRPPAGGGA